MSIPFLFLGTTPFRPQAAESPTEIGTGTAYPVNTGTVATSKLDTYHLFWKPLRWTVTGQIALPDVSGTPFELSITGPDAIEPRDRTRYQTEEIVSGASVTDQLVTSPVNGLVSLSFRIFSASKFLGSAHHLKMLARISVTEDAVSSARTTTAESDMALDGFTFQAGTCRVRGPEHPINPVDFTIPMIGDAAYPFTVTMDCVFEPYVY